MIGGYTPAQVAKAFGAAVIAAGGVIGATVQSGGQLTQSVWIAAAVAAVVGFIGVFLIPNAPPVVKPAPPTPPAA